MVAKHTHTGDEHQGSWRSSDVNGGGGAEAGNGERRDRSHRHGRGGKKRASSGDGDDDDEHAELSDDDTYSDKSGSIGSMGSDLDALEEDPFAAMEQDELDRKEEEMEKVKKREEAAAGGVP